jgi:hypothetical protein
MMKRGSNMAGGSQITQIIWRLRGEATRSQAAKDNVAEKDPQ